MTAQNIIEVAQQLVALTQQLVVENNQLREGKVRAEQEYEALRSKLSAITSTPPAILMTDEGSFSASGAPTGPASPRYNAKLRAFVAENYLKMSNAQMAKATKAGRSTVAAALKELGLRRPSRIQLEIPTPTNPQPPAQSAVTH